MAPPLDLYLASKSPRRQQLLADAGIRFALTEPGEEYLGDAHEHASESGDPRELCAARAARKAAGALGGDAAPVLGVDTVVDLDGHELGKAADRAAAAEMLRRLRGRVHEVHTAHCLRAGAGTYQALVTAQVRCASFGEPELEAYLDSEQWRGKAGAYGIQDPAQAFLELDGGAYDGVVGLHVDAVRALLARARQGEVA